jgi:hypothetical protein
MPLRYLDGILPLIVGSCALLFPQTLTKKDLQAQENAGIVRRLRFAGWAGIVGGVLITIAEVL